MIPLKRLEEYSAKLLPQVYTIHPTTPNFFFFFFFSFASAKKQERPASPGTTLVISELEAHCRVFPTGPRLCRVLRYGPLGPHCVQRILCPCSVLPAEFQTCNDFLLPSFNQLPSGLNHHSLKNLGKKWVGMADIHVILRAFQYRVLISWSTLIGAKKMCCSKSNYAILNSDKTECHPAKVYADWKKIQLGKYLFFQILVFC